MLTRRHIRVKVLQSVYAFNQSEHPDLDKQEKFLWYSIDQMLELYILMLQLLVAMRGHAEEYLLKSQKKHLATESELDPSRAFVDNQLLLLLSKEPGLKEMIENKKLDYWKEDDEYLRILFKSLIQQSWYNEYLSEKQSDFESDKKFVIRVYKEIIAPNEKLYDYIEDKRLTWVDDFPIVNTALVKILGKITKENIGSVLIPELYKNEEDRDFAIQLFRKVILNEEKLVNEIDGKTPNWDKDRIADLDMIILKMGITEFLNFPSIPVRATINEYLEISKEYSTPKSSLFINGILDKIVKELTERQKIKKIGRGLM